MADALAAGSQQCDLAAKAWEGGMRIVSALVLSAALSACSTVPEGAPEFARTVDVDYEKFGACAFRKMEDIWGTSVKLVDLRGEEAIRVSLEVTTNGPLGVLTVRQIEVYTKKAGSNRARVAIRTRALTSAEQAWSRVESCANS